MTINERIYKIISIRYKGNRRAFANAVGVHATVIQNIVGTRLGKPSYDVIEKICANAYINANWLITGKGEMLIKNENSNTEQSIISNEPPQEPTIKEPLVNNTFYSDEKLQQWLTFLIANLNKENEYNGYFPLFFKLNYIVMVFNRYLPQTQFNKIYQSYLNTDDESTLLKQFPSVIAKILETSEQLTSYETEINQIYNLTKEIAKKVGIIRK